MCYTCTYSLCKNCTKDADYVCVRGTKGLCSTCRKTIMLIENISLGDQEVVCIKLSCFGCILLINTVSTSTECCCLFFLVISSERCSFVIEQQYVKSICLCFA